MGKRGPCRFTERELARVLRAAQSAGVPAQVSIARAGGLTITPLSGPQDRPQVNEWDKDLAKPRP
jgi:hypothetical protein